MERPMDLRVSSKLGGRFDSPFNRDDEDDGDTDSCTGVDVEEDVKVEILIRRTPMDDDDISDAGSTQSSEGYVGHEEKLSKDKVPLETKKRIVALADQHPKWKLRTLQTKAKGGKALKHLSYLKTWRKQVQKGSTQADIFKEVQEFVFNRFEESRRESHEVHSSDLRRWALEKFHSFEPKNRFQFKAGNTWIENFKKRYNIGARKGCGLVSKLETRVDDEELKCTQELLTSFEQEFFEGEHPMELNVDYSN